MATRKNRKSNSGNVDWVSCDNCNRWELFENCKTELGLAVFDEERIGQIQFCCRICTNDTKTERLEKAVKDIEMRVDVLSGKLQELEESRLSELMIAGERKEIEIRRQVDDVGVKLAEIASKVAIVEIKVEDELKKIESEVRNMNDFPGKLDEMASKLTIVEIRVEEEVKNLKKEMNELSSQTAAVSVKMADFVEQWPTPGESEKMRETCKLVKKK
jgi:archaellum component FlaC